MSIFSALIGGAASLLGGGFSNAANARQANATNQFNAQQAEITRDWTAEQAGITRDWNADQADQNREFNSAEAAATRGFNAEQAQINRDYQTEMANTSFQRGVKDMSAAGINPMLAYMKGGAMAPSGSQASGPAASGTAASSSSPSGAQASGQAARFNDFVSPAINTAMQLSRNKAEVELMEADAQVKRAQAYTELRRPDNIDASTYNLRSGGGYMQEQARVADAQVRNILADTNLKTQQGKLTIEQIDQAIAQTKLLGSQNQHTLQSAVTLMRQGDLYEAQAILARLQQAEARASSSFFESTGETSRVAELARTLSVIFKAFQK